MSRFIVLVAIITFLASPLAAQSRNNELSLTLGNADVPGFGDVGTLSVHYNRYWTEGFSTKFGAIGFGGELDVITEENEGDLAMGAFTGSAEYHFFRNSLFSPYVGAGLALVASELTNTPVGDIEADSELTWLVSGGVDVNITPRFAITGDVTYMPYEVDFQPVATVGMDPTIISLGVKFRW
jgi:opacity protein-like surface antigen